MKKLIFVFITIGLFAAQASYAANGLKEENFYFGAGVGFNDADDIADDADDVDDATGWQIFAGYDTGVKAGPANLAIEVGYMDSGDFDYETTVVLPFGLGTITEKGSTDATGVWVTAVFDAPVNETFGILGRVGMDFGDDDGLMLGLGVGFNLSRQIELRGEYVIRDEIDSLQVNFVYHL